MTHLATLIMKSTYLFFCYENIIQNEIPSYATYKKRLNTVGILRQSNIMKRLDYFYG